MAGMPPGLLQAMAGGKSSGGKGKVPPGAIARRLAGKNKKKKKKSDPDASTDAAESRRGGPSKSDPDYKEDMAGN